MGIRYEQWPSRPVGGQHVGTGPSGIKGYHEVGGHPTGIEAACEYHRSQHKNRMVVQEMIEWALTACEIKDNSHE